MREYARIDKIWHWHITDTIISSGKTHLDCKRILRSIGWLFSILDHMIGKETYILNTSTANVSGDDILVKAIGFSSENNRDADPYILLSGYNINRNMIYDGYAYVDIPDEVSGNKDGIFNNLTYTYLSDDNDVYYGAADTNIGLAEGKMSEIIDACMSNI